MFGLLYLTFALVAISEGLTAQEAIISTNELTQYIFLWLGPIMIVWGIISFYGHRRMIFGFT
ncbi:MAG: hypothetical protein H6765_06475 [Candidatus Peribacteria bacterium]|nr:MAG: hypothetical protein H6765_06475 [Candidatus Peribacteria bacterium]